MLWLGLNKLSAYLEMEMNTPLRHKSNPAFEVIFIKFEDTIQENETGNYITTSQQF